jgi:ketosteroid isomerase-like protein
MTVRRACSTLSLFLIVAAACTPAAVDQAAAPGMVDTAATKAAMDGLRAQYMSRYAAGDAAGLAALYNENGTIDFRGAPQMVGPAGIEAGLKAGFGIEKPGTLEIVSQMTVPIDDSRAVERGTYHSTGTLNGKTVHNWGRWASSGAKDSTGAWRLNYLMAFADSTKTDK